MTFPSSFRSLLVGLLLALLVPAPASGQTLYTVVDATSSRIDYTGSAFLHDWTGTSNSVGGQVVLNLDAPSESTIFLRVPVVSFDSGNNRRDRNMRQVTDATTFATVTFASSDVTSEQWGRTQDGFAGVWRVTGNLTFHGQTQEITTSVEVRYADGEMRAATEFPLSLSAFGVDRPALVWVAPISDIIRLDADIVTQERGVQPEAFTLAERTDPSTGARVLESDAVRPVSVPAYPGRRNGFKARHTADSSSGATWEVELYGYTRTESTLSTDREVRMQVDDTFLQPLQVTSETRQEGEDLVEIKTATFTREVFSQIATADDVVLRVGDLEFALPFAFRKDLRLILSRVATPDTSAP